MTKKLYIYVSLWLLLTLMLSACGPRLVPPSTSTPRLTRTKIASSTPEPTQAAPTITLAPTSTSTPVQPTQEPEATKVVEATKVPEPTLAPADSTKTICEVKEQLQFITGSFEYSNDFVIETYMIEQAVSLTDMTGFVLRNKDWVLPIESQVLGFLKIDAENNKGTYDLALPEKPRGVLNDVDNNGKQGSGIQIFAVAYSPNLTGGPFSEGDDRTSGWPTYLASIKTDSENKDEVTGGKLVVWAPDDQQQFPTSFGEDGLLFTSDDKVAPLPAGYSVIDLDKKPFEITTKSEQEMTLYEPKDVAIKDYSTLSYSDSFNQMLEFLKKYYAFNGIKGKQPDWEQVSTKFIPLVKDAETKKDAKAFYQALKEFSYAFKDGHVGLSGGEIDNQAFTEATAYGWGVAVKELDDSSFIVVYITKGGPAESAGMKVGDTVTEFNGEKIGDALSKIMPFSAPMSNPIGLRYQQTRYLLRDSKEGTEAKITFTAQGDTASKTVTLKAISERQSFSATSVYANYQPAMLPVDFSILKSGIGYIRITSNYDDLNLIIRLFERALKTFTQNEITSIIIDLRYNSGGSPLGLAGFLTEKEIIMGQLSYYSDKTGKFESEGKPEMVFPNQEQYHFDKMALLVGQGCASACEIEAYGFSQVPGMEVVGFFPSSGIEAEVSRGQFLLPEGFSMQFPTGRFTLPDGSLFLEGTGIQPTLRVPRTPETVLSADDVELTYAENALTKPLGTGITPKSPPKLSSISDSEAALSSGKTNVLEDLAPEKYETNSKAGETYQYTIQLSQSKPLIWIYGWCATTQAILDDNMKNIKLKFTLDGQDVPLTNFASFNGENNSQYCQYYYVQLDEWTAGEHHIKTEVTFQTPINDGSLDYPMGTHVYEYTVFMKP